MYSTFIHYDYLPSNFIEHLLRFMPHQYFYLNKEQYKIDSEKDAQPTMLRAYYINDPQEHLSSLEECTMAFDNEQDLETKTAIINAYIKIKNELTIAERYNQRTLAQIGDTIIKYEKGQYIGFHKDWDSESEWVITHNKQTVHLSSILYLNDDFHGGNLFFQEREKEPTLVYSPLKNSVIFFDALTFHRTDPITDGVKYCVTNFYTLSRFNKII